MKSVYSPSENAIYPGGIYDLYESAGTWPRDGIEISDEEAAEFNGSNQPAGKKLGMIEGKLAWIKLPPPSREQEIAIADAKKTSLLSDANTYTQPWQTQLMLGIISDSDKKSLTTWMRYYQKVQAVDTSKAPDVTWPATPA